MDDPAGLAFTRLRPLGHLPRSLRVKCHAGRGLDQGIVATRPDPHLGAASSKRKSGKAVGIVAVAVVVAGSEVTGDVAVPGTETDPDAGARPRNARITADTLLARGSLGERMDGGAQVVDEVSAIQTGGTMRKNLGIRLRESMFHPTTATSMRRRLIGAEARTPTG